MSGVTDLGLCYLASPYDAYPDGHSLAFAQVATIAGALIRRGVKVFSPIAHAHMVACLANLQHAPFVDIWMDIDKQLLRACDTLLVVRMDGYRDSKGIADEILEAQRLGLPIRWLDPDTLEIEE